MLEPSAIEAGTPQQNYNPNISDPVEEIVLPELRDPKLSVEHSLEE